MTLNPPLIIKEEVSAISDCVNGANTGVTGVIVGFWLADVWSRLQNTNGRIIDHDWLKLLVPGQLISDKLIIQLNVDLLHMLRYMSFISFPHHNSNRGYLRYITFFVQIKVLLKHTPLSYCRSQVDAVTQSLCTAINTQFCWVHFSPSSKVPLQARTRRNKT